MQSFTPETAVIAMQLQQMLMEFTFELDVNVGRNVTQHYTEDGVFVLGPNTIRGRAEIRTFYDARDVRVAQNCKDGVRTARHTFTNLRYDIKDNTTATLYFISIFYAGEGNPPVTGLGGPSTVADCHMHCKREADGIWRIAEFAATPTFIGNDPFFAKAVSKQ